MASNKCLSPDRMEIGAGSSGFNQDRAKAIMLDAHRKLDTQMLVTIVVFERAKK